MPDLTKLAELAELAEHAELVELTELTEVTELAELAEFAELRWTKCLIALYDWKYQKMYDVDLHRISMVYFFPSSLV